MIDLKIATDEQLLELIKANRKTVECIGRSTDGPLSVNDYRQIDICVLENRAAKTELEYRKVEVPDDY
jgi:hypothetical protein